MFRVAGDAERLKSETKSVTIAVRIRLPDVPVMVTAAVPVAVLLAVNVTTLVPLVGFVAKAAVTPAGRPVALKVTAPLNVLFAVTVIVLVPLPPCGTLRLAGNAERLKSGATVIVKLTMVVWVKPPDVPVMVTAAVPVVAVLLAVSVSTLVPVVGLVVKEAVTPAGSPEAVRVTLPVKPAIGLTVTVLVPDAPCCTVRLEGDTERLKSGGCGIVRLIGVACVRAPDTPVTVTVDVPNVALLLAVKVTTLVPVAGFVPKAAVTPVGRPVALRVTFPVKPAIGLIVTVLVPLVPC